MVPSVSTNYTKSFSRRNPKGDGRKGDGTENVINCRDVCRKLSWHFYDDLWRYMTFYDVLCQWNKETEIVIKCRKLSWHVVNRRDVCRKLSWHFFFPSPSRRPLLVFSDFLGIVFPIARTTVTQKSCFEISCVIMSGHIVAHHGGLR